MWVWIGKPLIPKRFAFLFLKVFQVKFFSQVCRWQYKILLISQAWRKTWSVGVLVVASVAISTAAVAERYLTVIPSQTHGMMLPYEPGSYFPTWVEFTVVAGLYAFGALLSGLFMKAFPIIPLNRDTEKEEVLAEA